MIKKIYDKIIRVVVMLWNTFLWVCLRKKSIVINAFMLQNGLKIKHKNFGDDLNFYLMSALSGKRVFCYSSFFHPKMTNYVCIGSIVEDMSDEKSIIWGGGVMNEEYSEFHKPYKVLATRGPLSKKYLLKHGVDCNRCVYGDPALLAPIVYQPFSSEKKYKIGVIPHFSELNNPLVAEFISNKDNILLIDLENYKSWTDVIDKICCCEMIASSSLHGLILSDAYGIPNIWMMLNIETGGGEFKFHDYYLGVNKEFRRYEIHDIIDEDVIVKECKCYKGITFDPKTLMDVCPFSNESLRYV